MQNFKCQGWASIGAQLDKLSGVGEKKVILCVLLLFMLQILYKFFNTTVSNSLFSLWSEWRGGWERSQGLNLLIQCMPCLLVTEISVFMSHIIIWLYDSRVTLLVRFNRARYNFWRARLQSDTSTVYDACKVDVSYYKMQNFHPAFTTHCDVIFVKLWTWE